MEASTSEVRDDLETFVVTAKVRLWVEASNLLAAKVLGTVVLAKVVEDLPARRVSGGSFDVLGVCELDLSLHDRPIR